MKERTNQLTPIKMEQKTFTELELIGIVGTYHADNNLFVITKDANRWLYIPATKLFALHSKLE